MSSRRVDLFANSCREFLFPLLLQVGGGVADGDFFLAHARGREGGSSQIVLIFMAPLLGRKKVGRVGLVSYTAPL